MAGRHQAQGFSRGDRVAEQIRRDLVDLLRQVKDPRVAQLLPLVTITDIEVTPDYAHAKVFYTSLAGEERAGDVAKGLAHASGFLRRDGTSQQVFRAASAWRSRSAAISSTCCDR